MTTGIAQDTATSRAAAAADRAATRRIHLVQGEQCIETDPAVVITTILGSCVAACLRDPVAGIGGMNHFLLPGPSSRNGEGSGTSAERYGVHAMELLVNALLKRGAQRNRLTAKIFGGARMIKSFVDIGEQNAAFAERFLQAERIPVISGDLRGERGRRIEFWPVSGRARQIMLATDATLDIQRKEPRKLPVATSHGSVELF